MRFSYLFCLCFYVDIVSAHSHSCLLVRSKLNKYGIAVNTDEASPKTFVSSRLCQSPMDTACCSSADEDRVQNISGLELEQLFEQHAVRLSEPLLRLAVNLNGV